MGGVEHIYEKNPIILKFKSEVSDKASGIIVARIANNIPIDAIIFPFRAVFG